MVSSTGLTNVLEEILHAGREVESQLHKEDIHNNGVSGDSLDTWSEFSFPDSLEGARKQLANAAARLLQLATDPKEYLEQLSANVRMQLIL